MNSLASVIEKQVGEFRARFLFGRVFLIFGFLWVLAFWPALHDAWWYADDFWMGEWTEAQRWGGFVIGNGRPLLGLWSYSFILDHSANDQWANIILRWFQGGVHVLNAALIARLLWGVSRYWTAILAALPFLLWPFNADSVLWRCGSFYAIAALLSLSGLWAIRVNGSKRDRSCWIAGSCLCGLSMLAGQPSAFAGVAVWIVLVGLTALQPEPMPWRKLLREAAFLAAGITVGAAISYWLIKAYPLPPRFNRSALATDPGGMFKLLWDINRQVILFPGFYPPSLKLFHVLLGASALFALCIAGLVKSKEAKVIRRPILAVCCLALCLVLPYSAQLAVVAQRLVVLRLLYLAPIFFTACFVFLFQLVRSRVWPERASLLLLFLILVSYWPIARKHAAEFVRSYKMDLGDLRRVEEHAAQMGLTRVMVVPGMPFFRYNPHHFKYFMLCTHNSSLAFPWVRETFIRDRSGLRPICQPEDMPFFVRGEVDLQKAILHRAWQQKKKLVATSETQFQRIEGTDVMGIFLP